ncbi:transposase [Candidatus Gracilibacteria bacterium]|nr:transposase [Candidatus Gracilibacteria bacterium]
MSSGYIQFTMKEYITRTQFNSIKNHLIVKTGKPMMYDLFDVLNAVFHILITGSQWRNLPDSYPNWNQYTITTQNGKRIRGFTLFFTHLSIKGSWTIQDY